MGVCGRGAQAAVQAAHDGLGVSRQRAGHQVHVQAVLDRGRHRR